VFYFALVGLPLSDKSGQVVVVCDGGNVFVTCILCLLTEVKELRSYKQYAEILWRISFPVCTYKYSTCIKRKKVMKTGSVRCGLIRECRATNSVILR